MTDRFMGAWCVKEYVYSAAGTLLGKVRQNRRVTELSDGSLEVYQLCQPSASLDRHPMRDFRGEWVFRLTREGDLRRYHGPDVVGCATQWAAGMLTGRGIWPRFGCNFTSFSVAISPERQITGGTFSRAGEVIAVIVGLGVLQQGDKASAYPTLHGDVDAPLSLTRVTRNEDDMTYALTRRYGVREDTVGVMGTTPFEQIDISDLESNTHIRIFKTYTGDVEHVRFDLSPLSVPS